MSGHTPGPWVVVSSEWVVPLAHAQRRIGWSTDEVENRDLFADLITNLRATPKIPKDEMESNARLIAAAPELLEALIAADHLYSDGTLLANKSGAGAWINSVRAAITKATQPGEARE